MSGLWGKGNNEKGSSGNVQKDQHSSWQAGIKIYAGYDDQITLVYKGTVTSAQYMSEANKKSNEHLSVDTTLTINASTQDFSKKKIDTDQLPANMTYHNFVHYVTEQAGLSNAICKTSVNNQIITNPAQSAVTTKELFSKLKLNFGDKISVWIDFDTLHVIELDNYSIDDQIITYGQFLGIPNLDADGAKFTIYYDSLMKIGRKVQIKSEINPALGQNQTWLVNNCTYKLTSRSSNFYMNVVCQSIII